MCLARVWTVGYSPPYIYYELLVECDAKLKVMEDEEDNLVELDDECIMQVDVDSIPSENIPDEGKQKLIFDKIIDEDHELEKENFPPDNKTARKMKKQKLVKSVCIGLINKFYMGCNLTFTGCNRQIKKRKSYGEGN